MPVLLGAIADDFTGATDLANTLVRNGMRTVQLIGTPAGRAPEDVDAVVVALKTRTIPAADAVAQSLAALRWLQAASTRQIFFKYCSTFDSTDCGNIGPVADALMEALRTDLTVFCPAFPENGRTIYRGYLFVGDVLLSESGMRDHPLTPMCDANLGRVLERQTPHKVGLMPLQAVRRGPEAVRFEFARLRREGCRHAILDAVDDADLMTLGAVLADFPLVTGASGIALGLPENFRRAGFLKPDRTPTGCLRSTGQPQLYPAHALRRPWLRSRQCAQPTGSSTSIRWRSRKAIRWLSARSIGPLSDSMRSRC